MAEDGGKPRPPLVELPRGMYNGRLDDKGRLKIASAFQKYYENLEEKTLFVTSLDRLTGAIYTLEAWRATELFLEKYSDNPKAAEVMIWNANELGSEVEMDSQGRILFNSELRKEVGLEGELRLYKQRNHVEVVPEAIHKQMVQRAKVEGVASLETLKKAGLP